MKAIQYTAPRQFAVVDLPKPEPGPHQVVIRVKACGICKTDLTIHDGSFLAKFPLVNGHEFAGVIDSVGSAVTEWKVGDRVTADNTELCGYCEPCRSDKPLYCENFNSHGCNMPGGFAEYVLINHDKVFALSDKLSFEEATFTEPTACAVHGVDRIAPRFGDSILMFGAGPTGIILAQLLRRAGAGRMVIADPHADNYRGTRVASGKADALGHEIHDILLGSGRCEHFQPRHVFASESLRSRHEVYLVAGDYSGVDDRRGVVVRVPALERVADDGQAELSVDVALGYSGVHRVLERVSGYLYFLPDIRQYYRHSSVLADGHVEFRGAVDVADDIAEHAAAQFAFLALNAARDALAHSAGELQVSLLAQLCDGFGYG